MNPTVKLAIFDMDGTVFESYLDWKLIRKELGIQSNILAELYKEGRVDHTRLELLERYEEENTLKTKPIPGIETYLDFLRTRGVATALVTNNNQKNTRYLLEKYKLRFGSVLTREKGLWKPEPAAFHHVMETAGRGVGETVAIGDSHYDVLAARAAGITGIFVIEKENHPLPIDDHGVVYFKDYHHLQELSQSLSG